MSRWYWNDSWSFTLEETEAPRGHFPPKALKLRGDARTRAGFQGPLCSWPCCMGSSTGTTTTTALAEVCASQWLRRNQGSPESQGSAPLPAAPTPQTSPPLQCVEGKRLGKPCRESDSIPFLLLPPKKCHKLRGLKQHTCTITHTYYLTGSGVQRSSMGLTGPKSSGQRASFLWEWLRENVSCSSGV